MSALAQVVAVAVYLVPIAVVLTLAARRDRSLAWMAAAIPAVVAADLLGTMLLCWAFRLEVAALVSRLLWLAGGALWYDRRLRRRGLRPEKPAAVDRRVVAGVVVAALVGIGLSVILSRPYALWDRELHIPLVAALRGQRLPFQNSYDPTIALHYHFSGDVLAAMLQTYSFDVLNASLALSLAHDVMFALIGVTLGASLLASGRRPIHVVALSVAAVLLAGPCVLRFGVGEPYLGYSYYALYIWGFRPHQHIAMLMFAGVAGVLLLRGERPLRDGTRGGAGAGALVAMLALTSVTDETSAAVLGLCLAIAWLVDPFLIAPSRKGGAVLLGALAAAFVIANVALAASLSRGSPVEQMGLVAPRSPGVQQPPLPLSTGGGWVALIADTLPVWTIFIALVGLRRAGKRDPAQQRPSRGLIAFLAALTAVSIVGLTVVEINHAPPESHRFLTAALFMFPVFGVLALPWWAPGTARRALVLAGLTLGAFSTVLWLSHYPRHPTPQTYFQQRGENLHASDCRALAGARFGQSPELVYVEASIFYAWSGCRPSFLPGFRATKYWVIKLKPVLGLSGLRQMDREMVPPDAILPAICPAKRGGDDVDPVCAYARRHGSCAPEGTEYVRCALTPADRTKLVGAR
jgi:hypothetical protein